MKVKRHRFDKPKPDEAGVLVLTLECTPPVADKVRIENADFRAAIETAGKLGVWIEP